MNKGQKYFTLHKQGKTFTEIAKAEGVTKGIVAGAIFRFKRKYAFPESRINVQWPVVSLGGDSPRKNNRAPESKIANSVTVGSFDDVLKFDTCRFIEGDRPDQKFCGNPRHGKSSYCEEHHKRCYCKVEPKKRKNYAEVDAPYKPSTEGMW